MDFLRTENMIQTLISGYNPLIHTTMFTSEKTEKVHILGVLLNLYFCFIWYSCVDGQIDHHVLSVRGLNISNPKDKREI